MERVGRMFVSVFLSIALFLGKEVFAQEIQGAHPQIKVGAIYGLTGPLGDFAAEFRNGAEMFLQDRKSRGNTALSIIYEDSKWDPKTAVAVYKKLVNIDHVRMVHVMGSGTSLAIKPLSERDGVFLYTAGAHPDLLTESKLVIRHANIASRDAANLAEAILKQLPDARTIASIYIQNDWGVNFNSEFENTVSALRPAVAVASEPHLPDETDFKSHLLRLRAKKPDVFMVDSTGPAAALIIKSIRQVEPRTPIFANNGLVLSQEAQTMLRDAGVEGLYHQVYPRIDPAFRERYEKLFNKTPGYFALSSYTDYELINEAANKGGNDPSAMVDFIKRLGRFEGKYETLRISPDGDILIDTFIELFKP